MVPQGTFMLLPMLVALVYLGLIAYVLWLGTRLVSAVERGRFDARVRPADSHA